MRAVNRKSQIIKGDTLGRYVPRYSAVGSLLIRAMNETRKEPEKA